VEYLTAHSGIKVINNLMWVYPEIEIQIVNNWIFGDPISDFQTQVLIA
jgi:hypothetical protein